MIYGTGIDILDVKRMDRAWKKHGLRLARRFLASQELPQFESIEERHKSRWLAKRWAAKEALAKATGLGIRAPVSWESMTITHNKDGKPEWMFSGRLAEWMTQRNIKAHVSLSDEREWVVAHVILEQLP
ncbi:MAG: holo-ACP synthase [Pseudomonadota bacterium]